MRKKYQNNIFLEIKHIDGTFRNLCLEQLISNGEIDWEKDNFKSILPWETLY